MFSKPMTSQEFSDAIETGDSTGDTSRGY